MDNNERNPYAPEWTAWNDAAYAAWLETYEGHVAQLAVKIDALKKAILDKLPPSILRILRRDHREVS